MTDRISKLQRFFARRRIFCAVLALLVCASSAALLAGAKFRQNVYDLMPARDSVIADSQLAYEIFKTDRDLFFVVESASSASAFSAAHMLAEKLRKFGDVESVWEASSGGFSNVDLRDVVNAYPFIYTSSDVPSLEKSSDREAVFERLKYRRERLATAQGQLHKEFLLKDPLGISGILAAKSGVFGKLSAFANGEASEARGLPAAVLIRARANFSPKDSVASAALAGRISALEDEIESQFPQTKISYAGGVRVSADNARMASRDSSRCLLAAFVLISAICAAAFRDIRKIMLALIPTTMGTLVAFAVLRVSFPEISALAAAFASIAIGVSIDYAVHIICACEDIPQKGFKAELLRRARFLAKPIGIGCFTTLVSFAVIFFTGAGGFRQLGVFGFCGVAVSALASVFFLPALMTFCGGSRRASESQRRSGKNILDKIPAKFAVVTALVLTAVLLYPALTLTRFDANISNLSGMFADSRADAQTVRNRWAAKLPSGMVVIGSDSIESALEDSAKLLLFIKSRTDIAGFYSVSEVLRPKAEHDARAKVFAEFWTPEKLAKLRENLSYSCRTLGIKMSAYENFLKGLSAPKEFSAADFLNGTLGAPFKQAFAFDASKTYVACPVSLSFGADAYEFVSALKTEFPNAIYAENSFLGRHIAKIAKEWLVVFALVSLCIVGVFLSFKFSGVKPALMILSPVCAGLVWTFGILGLIGQSINLVNAIFVIFAVCMAEDYAVFLVCDKACKTKNLKALKALKAVFVCALTTVAGFGSLAFSQHPLLRGLGATSATAICCIFLACALLSGAIGGYFRRGNILK